MLRSCSVFALMLCLVVTAQVGSGTAAAASPDCQGRWFWQNTLDMPDGFWSEGNHFYRIRGKLDGAVVFTPGFVGFLETTTAPLYEGQAQLRFFAVRVFSDGAISNAFLLNPTQDTMFQVNDDIVASKRDADAFAARETFEASWDGGPWIELDRGPVLSFCAADPVRMGVWERQWGVGYRL